MKPEILIHGFETSNNMKVRVALGFKKIPYEFRAIDPSERGEIVRLSGQRLTPVMQHGNQVLFDSAAILRYVEANFRDRPPLFGSSHREQWAMEDWELFARGTLAAPITEIVHHRVSGGNVDDAMQTRCAADFAEAAEKLIGGLAGRDWLVGESLSVADVTAAPVVYRALAAKLFELPTGVEAIDGWIDRVMAFDRYLVRPAT